MDRDHYRKFRPNYRNDQRYRGNAPQQMTLRDSYLNDSHTEMRPPSFYGMNRFFPTPAESPCTVSPSIRVEPPSRSNDNDDLAFYFGNMSTDENQNQYRSSPSSPQSMTNSRMSPPPSHFRSKVSSLPVWTMDENKEIRSDLTLQKVVDNNLLITFATDKSGCHFLQSNFYGENTQHVDPILRERICQEVLGKREMFLLLCKNIFGNFFLQRIIEFSRPAEQEAIKTYIMSDISSLCLDKSACRVVQTALEKLSPRCADALVDSIPRDGNLMSICTDQNANHVIQKIVKKMSMKKWEFLVDFMCQNDTDNLLNVCQDKYGCRVVQTVVEVLSSNNGYDEERKEKVPVLLRLMNKILSRCQKLASNEFANYVIQHIIETPGLLGDYRNLIIEQCLLRNLLSMSQEKYASHVVERAFLYAPLHLLSEMMDEIFDGYIPHPETGKDALDILIFHQFGNYVVQRMLSMCCDSVREKRETKADGIEYREKFRGWLTKLCVRARRERSRLTRFSSGKKILEILLVMEHCNAISPYESLPNCDTNNNNNINIISNSATSTPAINNTSFFTSSNTAVSNDWSRRDSLSSESHHDFDRSNTGFPGNF